LNDPKAPSPALYQSEGTIRRSIRKKSGPEDQA
jgi:hypothetical protein